MSASHPTIILRSETKPLEHRSFAPSAIAALINDGYPVEVERSFSGPELRRIFDDAEYESAGATLVAEGSWKTAAPGSRIILGLKEIEVDEFPLTNDHITFSHCFKNQDGWQKVLSRFPRGGSVLYDLEFLVDEHGRRVSAFGYHAGFAGAALALKTWAWQLQHPGRQLPSVGHFTHGRGYYLNEDELVAEIAQDVTAGERIAGHKPTAFVMGALGRCGRGAVELFLKAGLPESNIVKWDLNETREKHGPYQEIASQDIFVNAIYLSEPIPPFINNDMLAAPDRRLSVVCDVSCDTTNPHNPIPIYTINTTFDRPTVPVVIKDDRSGIPLSVISIDHLPSLLPREASESFSAGMLESLMELKNRKAARVWADAERLFREKVAALPEHLQSKA